LTFLVTRASKPASFALQALSAPHAFDGSAGTTCERRQQPGVGLHPCPYLEVKAQMERSKESLPSGTITFLFTDIQGSTPLWERDPQAVGQAVARHHAILHAAAQAQGGHVLKIVGDEFQISFALPAQALRAERVPACGVLWPLSRECWGEGWLEAERAVCGAARTWRRP
jgi:class 3 adenylate cyclase